MKIYINEFNKLPLTFEYLEEFKKIRKNKKNVKYFIKCEQFNTNFLPREKPFKHLIRLI